jgi:hypothetical protein
MSHLSLVLQYLFRRDHLEDIGRNEQLIANPTFAVADHFRRAQVHFNHRLCSEKGDEQVMISRCRLFLDLEHYHDALFQIHQSRASDLSFWALCNSHHYHLKPDIAGDCPGDLTQLRQSHVEKMKSYAHQSATVHSRALI